MSSTILAKFTTKTGCTMQVLRANDGEHDHLGPGVMLTLRMEQAGDYRWAEVYLDPEAVAELVDSLGAWAGEHDTP